MKAKKPSVGKPLKTRQASVSGGRMTGYTHSPVQPKHRGPVRHREVRRREP